MTTVPHAAFTGVAIGGRGLLIEGPPGSGKSSLALALIDRGALLIGDDAVRIDPRADGPHALLPENTAGLIEIRNVGLVELRCESAPVALILTLDPQAPRFPFDIAHREIGGAAIPCLPFRPGDAIQALRAEHALEKHGLPLSLAVKTGESNK